MSQPNYQQYTDTVQNITRLESDNAALLDMVRTLRAQLEAAARELENLSETNALLAEENAVYAHDNAVLRADMAAAVNGLAEVALPDCPACGVQHYPPCLPTENTLAAYANGATTYTPVGERLVLDKLPY